ncbi:hypothetical protein M404DRAFT_1004301 [Pisolithus tinctorius Marx 270]|uniref:Uncharacterized protein n=1 Tax=Pisolithus tinctorius Marx 270 TaxID=870435 RepID=A0A0C3NXE1_PISTI|nr:hypothetical protein M404DRAFT_1004301 [Pisolithus tinctorius Marx 270]
MVREGATFKLKQAYAGGSGLILIELDTLSRNERAYPPNERFSLNVGGTDSTQAFHSDDNVSQKRSKLRESQLEVCRMRRPTGQTTPSLSRTWSGVT